jgi:hypothetical protein
MKIIITEDQLKLTVFQYAVDSAWQDFKDECTEKNFGWDYCDDTEFVTRIEVKTAYKTEPYAVKGMEVVELGIIFYIDTVFDSIDIGDYFWNLEKYLEPYLGKGNFKIKLLNVINENPRSNW